MIPEQRLESLESAIGEARQRADAERIGTHWHNCWTEHPACSVPVVEELVTGLRAAAARQVTLDRIIVTFISTHAHLILASDFDEDQKAELARIAQAWKAPT